MAVTEVELKRRISEALTVAHTYGQIDGDHHKAWVIDQMVRHLTEPNYDEWVVNYETGEQGEQEYEWDTGIAP